MSSQQLVIPHVLLIRMWNEYLSFVETRRREAPFALLNRQWNRSKKLADLQLTHLQISSDVPNALDILSKHKNDNSFSRLRSISLVNLTNNQVVELFDPYQLFHFPTTVVFLRVSAVEEVWTRIAFAEFIKRNQHIPRIYFNDRFDVQAGTTSASELAETFSSNHPLQSRIQVGEFVTLEAACPWNTHCQPYTLRWVNQCPCNNCPQKFCWGVPADCSCPYVHTFKGRCCPKYKFIVPKICLKHWKECIVHAYGQYICQDCNNRAIASAYHK